MSRPLFGVLSGTAAAALLLTLTIGGCNPLTFVGGDSAFSVFNLPPTVNVVVVPDPPRGVAPLTVSFDSSDSTDDGVIAQRDWDFGDGTTSQGISPVHIFQNNGVYQVRLTLTDDQGATSSRTITARVTDAPVAVLEVDRNSAENAPARFEFDATASFDPDAQEGDQLRYRWDFGDGAQEVIPQVAHTFASPGAYRVVLTVTDATGVTGTAEKVIEVGIPEPEIQFRSPIAGTAPIVCAQDSPLWTYVTFDVQPGVPFQMQAGLDLDDDPTNGNDIRLGARAPSGTLVFDDIDLTVPTALDLAASTVPEGEYRLWAELRTDRTTPQRAYADPVVYVVPQYPNVITGASPPVLPTLSTTDPQWNVVVPDGSNRIVFDIGPVELGDRLNISLLTTPGYGAAYDREGTFTILLLDNQQRMFAYFDDERSLFTADMRLVFPRPMPSFYVVLDADSSSKTPSVQVQLENAGETIFSRGEQVVYLDFDGTSNDLITVAGSEEFLVPVFNPDDPNTPGSQFDADIVAIAVKQRLETLFAAYDFTFLSSKDGDAVPATPHTHVYFETSGAFSPSTVPTSDLLSYGLPNYFDPRGESAAGVAAVAVNRIVLAFPALNTDATLGTAIGNSAAHQIGLLSGLVETRGVLGDVMSADDDEVSSPASGFEPSAVQLWDSEVGTQDATLILSDLYPK